MAAITSRMPNSRSTPTAKFSALRAKTIANLGAYMSTFSSSVPTYLYGTLLSGQYDIPSDLLRGGRGLHQHRAGRRLSRRRTAGGDLRGRAAGRSAARQMGIEPAELRKRNFIKTFPHQTPVIMAYDAGDYNASLKKAMEIADVKGFGKRKREAARHGKLRGLGYLDLYRGLRHRAVAGGRLARRRRRPVGIRRSARQPDRLGRSAHRLPRARAGARNDLRATGVGAARHSVRECLHRARRHRQGAVRHGHLWLALRRGRHVGDRQGARQDRGQGQEGRRLHAGSGRRRHRVQGRQVHRRRHRQVGGLGRRRAQRLYRAQIHRRRAGAGPEGNRVLRSDQFHFPGRLPHLRGRGRYRHRQDRNRRTGPRSTTSAP